MHQRRLAGSRPIRFALAFDEQTPPEDALVIPDPEALQSLTDEELSALIEQADAAVDDLYGDGTNITADALEALRALTEGAERLAAEHERRTTEQAERDAEAAELAARIRPVEDSEAAPEEGEETGGDEAPAEGDGDETEGGDDAPAEGDEAPEAIAASTPARPLTVNLSGISRGRARRTPAPTPNRSNPATLADVAYAAAGVDHSGGMTAMDMARVIDRRLMGFNLDQYQRAARSGRQLRETAGVAVIEKPFAEGLMIENTDREHVESVLARATDQSRLPGESLLASGGWCAPSETLYDLFELETRDGLVSLPEVGVRRGGISFTPGPDFSTIYAEGGFDYTEAEDIDGDYDGEGAGSKPCFRVDCPDFEEERLGTAGVCITAGLLQSRGYPEVIARTVRGALIAHEHRLAAAKIGALVAGSTDVNMPADQVGAAAPLLTAVELQATHYREVHRMRMDATLEAIFPHWVFGVVRADLARRLGLAEFDVSNQRIMAWFRDRNIAAQFVYNWQSIGTTAASGFTSWPTSVDFLLYAAGTWVIGTADVITIDTLYDSVLLGTNDYTALFTEEGWLAAKRGHDSRAVTVPICPDGATHIGVAIDCDGSTGS